MVINLNDFWFGLFGKELEELWCVLAQSLGLLAMPTGLLDPFSLLF